MWMRSVVRHSAGRRLAPGCGCPHWQCAGRAVRLRQYSATPQRGATRTGSAAAPRSKIHNLGSVGGWVLGKLPPRVVTLTEHFIAFLRAYIKGGKLLIREGRVAARLFQRIYLSGHRYSRKERLLMRQSAHDLAKALPMAGLMLTLGLEISTLVVLRGAPGMLPSQLQRTVVPEFQKITGAESTEVAKMNLRATERLDKMHTAVNDLKDTFANDAAGLGAASADEKAALMKFLDDLDDHNAFLCHSDILEMAPLFRRCWTLDQMGRAQLRSVADYIMPSRANVVAPASILRFNLRRRVQHLRVDDKDIYWEGVRSLDYEDLFVACNERGLCRRTGQAFNKKLMTPQSKAILRARLNSWLQLSLNREVPSSLLLLSVAFIMRDTMTVADKRGPQAVKIAVLETKQRRYHKELKILQGKIRDIGLDLQRERSELDAAEQAEQLAQRAEQDAADALSMSALERSGKALDDAIDPDKKMDAVQRNSIDSRSASFDEEAETAATTTTQLEASTTMSQHSQFSEEQREKEDAETRAQKDRKLLSLLRSKEERAVREHWECALDCADMAARGIGARRLDTDRWRSSPGPNRAQTLTVDETVTALYGLLAGHKSVLAVDRGPILSYLVDERGETDEDGVDFIEYVEGYMELRRRAEERTSEQRRAEAVAKLEQLLDSDGTHEEND